MNLKFYVPFTFRLASAAINGSRRFGYIENSDSPNGMRPRRYDYGELHNSEARNGPPLMGWSRNGALLLYKLCDLPAIQKSDASFIAALVTKSPMA